MDSYLDIARTVLKSVRQPMSARQILRTAHQLHLVPSELFGQTQHKTMQARLATDILKHRLRSEFYRTGPGRFYLRMFLTARAAGTGITQEYHAPLRTAQLGRFDVVAFSRTSLAELAAQMHSPFSVSHLCSLPWRYARLYQLRRSKRFVPFRFHLLLLANDRIYLDNRRLPASESDLPRHSVIGIEGVVKWSDRSLFSTDEFGLLDAAIRTLFERFELPQHLRSVLEESSRWSDPRAVVKNGGGPTSASPDLVVYLRFECSDVTEITDVIDARMSAEWLPLPVRLNDIERFDKWSARLVTDQDLQAQLCS